MITPLFANRWLIALPPIWLVGMGALSASLVLIALWGLLRLIAPRAAAEAKASLHDGFLGPLAWLLLAASGTAIALTPLVPARGIGQSLSRLLTISSSSTVVTIAPGSEQEKIDLPLRPQELETITFETDQPITIRTQKPIEGFALLKVPDIDLDGQKPWSWEKSEGKENPFLGKSAQLEVTNLSDGEKATPAHLAISWKLVPEFPEVVILPISAAIPVVSPS